MVSKIVVIYKMFSNSASRDEESVYQFTKLLFTLLHIYKLLGYIILSWSLLI